MSESIVLVGLPGAGKTRFQRAFCQTFSQVKVEVVRAEHEPESSTSHLPREAQIWCVIDIRSPVASISAEAHLKTLLAESTAIVLSFVAEAELSMQVYWQNWLKKMTQNSCLESVGKGWHLSIRLAGSHFPSQ